MRLLLTVTCIVWFALVYLWIMEMGLELTAAASGFFGMVGLAVGGVVELIRDKVRARRRRKRKRPPLEPRPFLTPEMPRWSLQDRSTWPSCREMLDDTPGAHPTPEDTDG